ncbi:hypothetical protein GC194_11525 [bacterium]|nr:hypothetical protein [bacterium]
MKLLHYIAVFLVLATPLWNQSGVYQLEIWLCKVKFISLAAQSNQFDNQLVKLNLSRTEAEQLHWRNSFELSYKGKSYDVVKSLNQNDSSTLFCLADAEEDELKKKLHNWFIAKGKNGNPQDADPGYLSKKISELYYHYLPRFSWYIPSRNTQNQFYFNPTESRALLHIKGDPPETSTC